VLYRPEGLVPVRCGPDRAATEAPKDPTLLGEKFGKMRLPGKMRFCPPRGTSGGGPTDIGQRQVPSGRSLVECSKALS
jgi:hypothetical protein